MNAQRVICLARKHVVYGKSDMESSARLCLADAVSLYDQGDYANAKARAIKAIAYMVGVFHKDYQRATR